MVTFGDSITDGFNSTVDANRRWPDRLAERLLDRRHPQNRTVVNEGISGNRLLHNVIGPDALSRFDRDVISQAHVEFVTVLLGINDVGFPAISVPNSPPPFGSQNVTSDQMIQAYRQLIARAHAKGIKIIGATLTPFEGAGYATAEGEAKRQAANNFIRSSGEFDAVIDFDRVTRDPTHPARLAPQYDSGDHLHPNDSRLQGHGRFDRPFHLSAAPPVGAQEADGARRWFPNTATAFRQTKLPDREQQRPVALAPSARSDPSEPSPRAVLLLHGATLASYVFDLPVPGYSLQERLAAAGWASYALDVRGYGRSSRPVPGDPGCPADRPFSTAAESVADVADAVRFLRHDRRHAEVVLVGYSWGTILAGRFVTAYPGAAEQDDSFRPDLRNCRTRAG